MHNIPDFARNLYVIRFVFFLRPDDFKSVAAAVEKSQTPWRKKGTKENVAARRRAYVKWRVQRACHKRKKMSENAARLRQPIAGATPTRERRRLVKWRRLLRSRVRTAGAAAETTGARVFIFRNGARAPRYGRAVWRGGPFYIIFHYIIIHTRLYARLSYARACAYGTARIILLLYASDVPWSSRTIRTAVAADAAAADDYFRPCSRARGYRSSSFTCCTVEPSFARTCRTIRCCCGGAWLA